jgi:two-component system, NarL family, response regulator NreC
MSEDRAQAPVKAGKVRVLIADDHAVLREGVALLIDREADMCVVGQASGGREALKLARQLNPDVAVIDLSMPDMNGVQASEQLLASCPQVRVIALTRHADAAYLHRMLGVGAKGYVLKRTAAEDLVKAIRMVARGSTFIDAELRDRFHDDLLGRPKQPTGGVALTGRETDVLRLVAWGYSNAEIARRLNISVKTAEFYRACAVDKLNLRGRSEIVRYALGQGWMNDDNAPDSPGGGE